MAFHEKLALNLHFPEPTFHRFSKGDTNFAQTNHQEYAL